MFMFHLCIYGNLIFFIVVSTVSSSITLSLGSVLAAEKFYKLINERIFKNPLSLFDTTPIGRILNRVSKDIDTIDNILPMMIRSFIEILVSVS